MTTSKIETEILKLTGVKVKDMKGPRQKYLKKVFAAVNKLADEEWEELSEPAQKWANTASEAKADSDELPDFPDLENGDGDGEKPKATGRGGKKDKKGKKASGKKTGVTRAGTKKGNGTAAAGGKRSDGKKSGVKIRIKQFVLKNPKITVEDLVTKLAKEGYPTSESTIRAMRSEFRHSLKVLKDEDALSIEIEL